MPTLRRSPRKRKNIAEIKIEDNDNNNNENGDDNKNGDNGNGGDDDDDDDDGFTEGEIKDNKVTSPKVTPKSKKLKSATNKKQSSSRKGRSTSKTPNKSSPIRSTRGTSRSSTRIRNSGSTSKSPTRTPTRSNGTKRKIGKSTEKKKRLKKDYDKQDGDDDDDYQEDEEEEEEEEYVDNEVNGDDDVDDKDNGIDEDIDEDNKEVNSSKKRKGATSVSPKRRGKAKPKTDPSSSAKKGKKERDYGSIEDRTCPYCKKVFTIITGLAYHIEHKVCQKEATAKSNRKKNVPGTYPYPKLQPNTKFVTRYGIVKVISDSRAPPDHNKTPIPEDVKEKNRIYIRKKDRIQKRKSTFMMFNAKKQRKRRSNLMDIYVKEMKQNRAKVKYEDSDDDGGGGGSGRNDDIRVNKSTSMPSQIWREYCTLTTPSLILSEKYNQNMDGQMLAQIKTIEKHPWNELGPNPLVPDDSYPDRMVECVLIQDERMKVCNLDIGAEGEGRLSQMNSARKSIEKARRELRRKQTQGGGDGGDNADEDDDKQDSIEVSLHESGLKLFLQRKLLVNSYNPKVANYHCYKCNRHFNSRMGLKGHLEEQSCVKIVEKAKKERALRLLEIEKAALSNNIKAPQPLITPKKSSIPRPGSGAGSKSKRKKHKKWPAWLEFYPDLSSIYPEIFNYMQFKRGSNNSKFMLKKFDAIGPGRKKVRKSRAKKNLPQNIALSVIKDVEAWMDYKSHASIYPEVLVSLFPEFRSSVSPNPQISTPPRRSASRIASKKANGTFSTMQEDIIIKDERDNDEYNRQQDYQQLIDDNNVTNFHHLDVDKPMPDLPTTTLTNDMMPPLPDVPLPVPVDVAVASPKIAVSTSGRTILNDDIKIDNNTELKQAEKESIDESLKTSIRKKKKRKKSPMANPKPITPVIVDIRPLVEEIRAGRYPSMKEYDGDHPDICFVCKNKGDDLYACEFCENSEHLACVQSKVTIRDPEPDDAFMCHRCIQTVMARRARAEKRRLQKLDEAMRGTPGGKGGAEDTTGGISAQEAKVAAALKREVVWSQKEFDAHVVSYQKCPSGGPGGLICCSPCTAAYSRLLSETSKEMDSQTVSSIGREVSEMIQLLHDAQTRLQQSVDVSNANDTRMNLLNKDQVGFDHHIKSANDSGQNGHVNMVGFMDMFDGK